MEPEFDPRWPRASAPSGARKSLCAPAALWAHEGDLKYFCGTQFFSAPLGGGDIEGGGMGEICAPRRFPLAQKGNHDYFWAHKLFRTQRVGISVHRSAPQKTGRLVKSTAAVTGFRV